MKSDTCLLGFVGKGLVFGLFFLMTLGLSHPAFAGSLNLSEGTGTAGTDVTIPVTLGTGGLQIAAVAMDIRYNTSLLETPRATNGPVANTAGKQVFSSSPSSGVFRIGVIGLTNNTPIGDGVVAYVTFRIKNAASSGDTPLSNTSSGSDPSGNRVSITGNNGVIHIP
jgi:hypothetical protein